MIHQRFLVLACLIWVWGIPLAACAEPGPHRVEVDLHGDPLPAGAVARLGTERLRHGHFITSLAFAPDGKTLAAKDHESVSLWDLATGKRLRKLTGQSGPYGSSALAVSPDGKIVAFGEGTRSLVLWETATGKPLRRFPGKGGITSLVFSPDGKFLILGGLGKPRARGDYGMEAVLVNVENGAEVRRFVGHTARVAAVALSVDGLTLATASYDGTLRLWEVSTGKERRQLSTDGNYVETVAFSPDRKLVAAGDSKGNLTIWQVDTGKKIRQWMSGAGQVYSVAFSPDGKHLVCGCWRSHLIPMWEVATGNLVRQFGQVPNDRRSSSICSCVAFSPDGKTLAGRGHHHGVLSLWDVATGAERHTFDAHQGAVQALAASSDGHWLASGGRDGAVYLWQPASAKLVARLSKSGAPVKKLAFAPDSKILAAVVEGSIRIWDVAARKELPALAAAPQEAFTCLSFAGNEILVAGLANGTVSLCNARTGKKVRQFQAHPIRFDPDGERYASPVTALAVSADAGTLATALDADGSGYFFDARSGKLLRPFRATSNRNSSRHTQKSLAFSADGKTLFAGCGEKMVSYIEVSTGMERHHIAGRDVAGPGRSHSYLAARVTWSYSLAYSADGRTTASWGHQNDLVRLWDSTTGEELAKLYGHDGYVNAAIFSPDGRRLFSAGEDTTILVWDADVARKELPPPEPLSREEAECLWHDLGGKDAARAYQAINRLAMAPEVAVGLCRSKLSPIPAPDAKRIDRLIADLDDGDFLVRERATEELEKLGRLAAPSLQKALAGQPPLEVRRRLERLLARLDKLDYGPDLLRALRAIEVLERLGTAQARQLLEELSRGATGAILTQDARRALHR